MVPQIGAMFAGDRSRKNVLVDYGFRLPSAKDNRPLRFDEFWKLTNQVVFVSATPADWEIEKCGGIVVEQVIRPTGLIDPLIHVRPARNQVNDLIEELSAGPPVMTHSPVSARETSQDCGGQTKGVPMTCVDCEVIMLRPKAP